ncbi:hypothetical protein HY638_04120 [Candidatus Woesearchaeota archaeon]|nr:hypothetical protein [Candidatus Woesearchaeota archaeon]
MKDSIDDYLGKIVSGSGKVKNLEFSEIKREVDELVDTEDAFKSFRPALFGEQELAQNSDALLKLRMLVSQLKERSEINEKLESLAYYLGQMRYSLFSQDKKSLKKVLKKFLDDDTNIRDLLSDIQKFKKELEDIESAYREIIAERKLPIDVWISHVTYLEQQLKLFSRIQERQSNIAFNIGRLFVGMAKKELKK